MFQDTNSGTMIIFTAWHSWRHRAADPERCTARCVGPPV